MATDWPGLRPRFLPSALVIVQVDGERFFKVGDLNRLVDMTAMALLKLYICCGSTWCGNSSVCGLSMMIWWRPMRMRGGSTSALPHDQHAASAPAFMVSAS